MTTELCVALLADFTVGWCLAVILQLGLCLGAGQILWEKKDSNTLLKVGGLVHVLHAERLQKGTVSYP